VSSAEQAEGGLRVARSFAMKKKSFFLSFFIVERETAGIILAQHDAGESDKFQSKLGSFPRLRTLFLGKSLNVTSFQGKFSE
jgi:hypothetical protein